MKEVVQKVPFVILNAVRDLLQVAIGGRFFALFRRTIIGKRTFWTASFIRVS